MTTYTQAVTVEVAERQGQVVKVTRSVTYYTTPKRTWEAGVVLWKRSTGSSVEYFAQEWAWWSDAKTAKLGDFQDFDNFDDAVSAYGRMGGLV